MLLKAAISLSLSIHQGCQFTSQEWIYQLTLLGVKISMDGKGRALDNIPPIERFWRSIKYEEVYLNTYESVQEARENFGKYITWYNTQRRHSGIHNHRPYEVMIGAQQATRWAFQQTQKLKEIKETQLCGYVDNSSSYPTDPQSSTTAIKQIKIKQKTKVTTKMNLSSKIAA